MKAKIIIRIIISLLFILGTSLSYGKTSWQTLAKGLQYTQLTISPGFPNGSIHAFKFNLKNYRLDLDLTHNNQYPLLSVKSLVLEKKALLGINGGFFTPDLKPVGLRIKNHQVQSPIKNISWWGVFYIKNNKAYIVKKSHFKNQNSIKLAVQSGPRLIINGRIPRLKPGLAHRSALCITKQGDVIILATQNLLISTKQLANIIRKPLPKNGLGCYNALNLDGGNSTQLYANIGTFQLNIPSFVPVADALLVYPKVHS